jgi:hypothetical protein
MEIAAGAAFPRAYRWRVVSLKSGVVIKYFRALHREMTLDLALMSFALLMTRY